QFACLLILALTAGCASPAAPASTATPTTPTPTATAAPTDTDTPVPPTATRTATHTPTPTPTDTPVPTDTPTPTKAAATLSGEFTPKVASLWDTPESQDIMTGTCTGGPIRLAYGYVQIAPQGDTLTWLDQASALYTFFRTGPNTFYYSYSGPTLNGDGTVTMTLRFTSATTLVMQRVFTPSSDPACQHTHNYTGQFQWNVP
ncbi:MAG: hypothetical protein AABZ58_05090, partial [Chloroflexota bacterium]